MPRGECGFPTTVPRIWQRGMGGLPNWCATSRWWKHWRRPRRSRLFGLKGFEVPGEVVDAHSAEVLVPSHLRKDRPPHGHFAGAVTGGQGLFSGDDSLHAGERELASAAHGDFRQVGDWGFEHGRHGAAAFGVFTVTGGAVGGEE